MDKGDSAVQVVVKRDPGEDKATYEKRIVVTLLKAMRAMIVNEIRKIPREFFYRCPETRSGKERNKKVSS